MQLVKISIFSFFCFFFVAKFMIIFVNNHIQNVFLEIHVFSV